MTFFELILKRKSIIILLTLLSGTGLKAQQARDLVEVKRKDGSKEYYLYPHSRGPKREAMVAKGKCPEGPFTPVNLTPDGKRTVPGSILG